MRILFIVRNFSHGGAQPLRFRKFVEQIKKQHQVYILEFSGNNADEDNIDGVSFYRLIYSKIGAIFNKTNLSTLGDLSHSITKRSLSLKLFRFTKRLLFPDPFVIEISKTKKKVLEIIKKHNIEIVVGSAHPFSILKIAKTVQNRNIPFVYDIGDPFYTNAKNSWFKNILARQYEKKYLRFINGLIVTNIPTKELYRKCYENTFSKTPIFIVEQGVELPDNILDKDQSSNYTTSLLDKERIQLLYAGQFYDKLREPFQLYEAIHIFNKEYDKKVNLSVFGNISQRFIPRQQPDYITFKGYTPNEKIWKEIIETDIVVFIDNAYGIQTPGKIFEVIASQKPVLFISNYKNSPACLIAKGYPNIFFSRNDKISIVETINSIIKTDISNFEINNLSDFIWQNRASEFSQILKVVYSEKKVVNH